MRNMLALIGLAMVVFGGVGWYRDWYRVQSRQAEAGHQSVNIDINSTKIMSDVEKGIQQLEAKKQQLTEASAKPTDDGKTSNGPATATKAPVTSSDSSAKNDPQ